MSECLPLALVIAPWASYRCRHRRADWLGIFPPLSANDDRGSRPFWNKGCL